MAHGGSISSSSTDSFLFCQVCDVQASSEAQLRSHLLGQRHWYNVRQRDVAQRSVYVRGFPTTVGVKELTELFKQFGNVHKVILNEEKKTFAIIEFTSPEGALQTLRYPHELTLGGSKLVVKPRELKSKVNRSGSVAMETEGSEDKEAETNDGVFASVRLKLKREQMVAITSKPTINEQIDTLSSSLHVPSLSLTNTHNLLSYLQSWLRRTFPLCRVLPFGSMVTGLATPKSDLDAIVLTQWSQQDEANLGHTYFTPVLSDETPSIDDITMDTNTCPAPTHNLPEATPTHLAISSKVRVCSNRPFKIYPDTNDYVNVVNCLSKLKDCYKVTAMPNARCPIIRFTHRQHKITCDLSVNRRLGAYNSKLLRAYFNFDPRVIPLLQILKSWLRSNHIVGVNKQQLSNYALSLMVIYSLQKTTPPVLPCLQSLEAWPRNMAWFRQQGFSLAKQPEPLLIDGWSVDYVDPQSLLPSQNKASLGELLHHFFNYYAHRFQFSTHAITIHSKNSDSGHPLTIQEATQLASTNLPQDIHSSQVSFRISALCIQDPFDLTHNVTKSLSLASLNGLVKEMKRACTIMSNLLSNESSNELGILSLFTVPAKEEEEGSSGTSSGRKFRDNYTLCFNLPNIHSLVSKIPLLSSLSQVLPLIDINSLYVHRKIQIIVLRCLVILLENLLQFECTPVTGSTSFSSEISHDIACTSRYTPTVAMATGVLSRDVTMTTTFEDTPTLYKRPLGSDDIIEIEHKKLKMAETREERSPIDIIDQYCYTNEGVWFPSHIKCTAHSNTWRGTRYKRRHQIETTSDTSRCVLEFTMSLSDLSSSRGMSGDQVVIDIKSTEATMNEELSHFFAYFRKLTL